MLPCPCFSLSLFNCVFSALLDCLSDIYSSLCLCHSLPLLPLKRSPSVGPTSKGRRVSTITCALWSQRVSLNMLCCPRHCWCLICVCLHLWRVFTVAVWLHGSGFWNIFCQRHWCVESVMFDIMGVLLCVLPVFTGVCVFFIFILYSWLCSLVNGHAWCMGYACCGSN